MKDNILHTLNSHMHGHKCPTHLSHIINILKFYIANLILGLSLHALLINYIDIVLGNIEVL